MRLLGLTAFFCFSLALCSANDGWPLPPEDLEASGDDLEMEGSGSGSGSDEVIAEVWDHTWSSKLGKGKEDIDPMENQKYGRQGPEREQEHEHPWNRKSITIQESRSFLESKEVLAGVIAGGIGGLVLGVVLAGFLIYKWKKKDPKGYSQGMRRTEQDYLKHPRGALRGEDVVLV